MKRRTAVTGIGVIAPNGIGKEAFWKALEEGRSGIKRIKSFDASSFPTQIAGEVRDFDPFECIPPRDVKRTSRAIQFAIASAQTSMLDSQLQIHDGDEVGVIMGISASAAEIVEMQHAIFLEKGMSRVSPFTVMSVIPSAPATNIAKLLGCKGSVLTISNSCASGLDAIGHAFRNISCGRDKVYFAGGTDAQITPFSLAMLCAPRAMSTRNDEPEKASRPFDKNRDGGILSEGCGVLVLEDMDHAIEKGKHIYAEILGYASRCDGNETCEEMKNTGIERTIRHTLEDAEIEPSEVGYICAHGPSDEFDKIETMAIKQVFGKHAYKIPVSSIKSMIGNPLAAAGPLQLIASTMVFERNIIPPTINHEEPDIGCDLDYVPNKSRKSDNVNTILINSHGFGGLNASLVIKRFQRAEIL